MNQNHTRKTEKITLSAMFLAIGIVLPFLTMQIPMIGQMLLPMHIPVLLCGFICGGPYGLCIGFVLPILRSVLFGMPAMFPNAIGMAVELAVYGLITGMMYKRTEKILPSLIAAMIIGRIAWGIVSVFLYKITGDMFTWKLFVVQGFANAIPGIIIQLVLIPGIVSSTRQISQRRWRSEV